jgi:hypothetical protein
MLSALRRIFNSKHTFQMIAPISASICRRMMLFALAALFADISGAAEPKVFDGMIRIPAGILSWAVATGRKMSVRGIKSIWTSSLSIEIK